MIDVKDNSNHGSLDKKAEKLCAIHVQTLVSYNQGNTACAAAMDDLSGKTVKLILRSFAFCIKSQFTEEVTMIYSSGHRGTRYKLKALEVEHV